VTPRLEVEDLTVRFGDTIALASADLAVAPGEIVVVLGPSGSGKSTLLRAIAGLDLPTEGRVRIDGVDHTSTPPHRRGVGLMFQDHALFPHLDVGANVAFGLRMRATPTAASSARVAELLDLVGLAGMEHRAVQTLSGGEQQRVALARSLAPEPRVLLLDEPLGALDRPLRERLVDELRALFRRLEVTVVAVTHDHPEAFALADRLVVVEAGEVLQTGAPASVWEAPNQARVARLLGFTNVAPARAESGRLVTPWGDLGPADGAVGAVLVRPEGVHPHPAGAIEGRVASRTFAGTRTRVRVAVAGAPDLDLDLPGAGAGAPEVGAPVRLHVAPDAVRPLPG
jgi:thiamine transport system ATP-binding protein